MLFYNHNSEFGEPGPFEAVSKASLADEMADCFAVWSDETGLPVERMREKFIDGLEEVESN